MIFNDVIPDGHIKAERKADQITNRSLFGSVLNNKGYFESLIAFGGQSRMMNISKAAIWKTKFATEGNFAKHDVYLFSKLYQAQNTPHLITQMVIYCNKICCKTGKKKNSREMLLQMYLCLA